MKNNKSLIMIVDDQPDFVEGVKLILEEEGYDVWTASNGREALDKLTTNLSTERLSLQSPTLPDLILADIMMPVMDGYALYEQAQNNPHLKYIPFIFLTAKTDSADIEYGKTLGVEDYLTKPCLPDVLLASVRGQLRTKAVEQAEFQLQSTPVEEPKDPTENQAVNKGVLIVSIGIVVTLIVVTIFQLFNFSGA